MCDIFSLYRIHTGVGKDVDGQLVNKPMFGVYFIPEKTGTIHVGDNVIIRT